jgi:ABC-type multidrug transport system ATPase subunit
VPQEIEFFEGSVAENIARLGEIDPEKVVQAAKLIGMHETILAFPDGYNTQLGETGYALSGGQRQRLAIARAFYGMPKYIVMDEPNANLDEVGESALVNAVAYMKSQGSAIVMTTHRPRLVSVVDNLLVLRNGQQVGFGPADEMINAVRNLQVVTPGEQAQKDSVQEVQIKEATNDLPVEMDASAVQSELTTPAVESQVPPVNQSPQTQAQTQTQAVQASESSAHIAKEPAKEGQSATQSAPQPSSAASNTPGAST